VRTPEENRETSRRFIDEVFNMRNLKHAEEMLAEPFIEHNPLDPRMGNGKAAAIASFQGILDATPDLRVEVHDLIATPDRVAIRATYSGTDSGTGWGAPMGVPATGKPFSVEGIDVAILDEAGMFREHYGLFDVMGMMGQLGLLPAPG
jgi:steroid delta-isomerase-like uncharacterized protein